MDGEHPVTFYSVEIENEAVAVEVKIPLSIFKQDYDVYNETQIIPMQQDVWEYTAYKYQLPIFILDVICTGGISWLG